MKRAPLNLLIDAVAALLIVGMVTTGYVIRYPLPPGTHQVLHLWGLNRHHWGEIHFWLSAGLLGVLLLHLALHGTWVVTMTKRYVGGHEGPVQHPMAIGLATVLLIATAVATFGLVAHLQVRPVGHGSGTTPVPIPAQPDARGPSFWAEVYPILERHCLPCHGPTQHLGHFRVDRREDFFGGPGRKTFVIPGASAASELLAIVSGGRPQMAMAPRHLLPTHDVDVLKSWIDAGADWPPRP